MNVLDENISDEQRQLLRGWSIPVRQIGQDVGRKGMLDDAIIPFLRDLCHLSYCLVYLSVGNTEVATFVRRFLRHPAFATYARRRGTVVRVAHTGIHIWRFRDLAEETFSWPP